MSKKKPTQKTANTWLYAASRLLPGRKGPEIGREGSCGLIVVARVAGHLCMRVLRARITHVVGELIGRGRGLCREHGPGVARLLSSFAAHVVTAEAVLPSDQVTGLDRRHGSLGPRGRDRTKDSLLVAQLEPPHPPGDLWLVGMREDLEARRELGMRDHIRPHRVAVPLGILWPTRGRLSVHLEHEQRMMRGEVGT